MLCAITACPERKLPLGTCCISTDHTACASFLRRFSKPAQRQAYNHELETSDTGNSKSSSVQITYKDFDELECWIVKYERNGNNETTAKQSSEISTYAATDEAIQPNNSYQMSGNKISVKTLNLNRDFSEIAAQLNAIVDEYFSD